MRIRLKAKDRFDIELLPLDAKLTDCISFNFALQECQNLENKQ